MEHTQRYTRLSDLLAMAKNSRMAQAEAGDGKPAEALQLIRELLHAVEVMSIDERETLMSVLNGWVIAEKFEAAKYPVLFGLQKFCISVCLEENPQWRPLRIR